MVRRWGLVVVGCVLIGGGCSLPEGGTASPSELHYRWLHVRAGGDMAALWALLDPSVRAEFEAWFQADRETRRVIQEGYPKEDADRALAAMGGGAAADAQDAQGLFAAFVATAPAEVSGLGSLGARVRSEEFGADGTSATLRTYGGDEVSVLKGSDGAWYATLAPDEAVRLKTARSNAETNLVRAQANVKKLKHAE